MEIDLISYSINYATVWLASKLLSAIVQGAFQMKKVSRFEALLSQKPMTIVQNLAITLQAQYKQLILSISNSVNNGYSHHVHLFLFFKLGAWELFSKIEGDYPDCLLSLKFCLCSP